MHWFPRKWRVWGKRDFYGLRENFDFPPRGKIYLKPFFCLKRCEGEKPPKIRKKVPRNKVPGNFWPSSHWKDRENRQNQGNIGPKSSWEPPFPGICFFFLVRFFCPLKDVVGGQLGAIPPPTFLSFQLGEHAKWRCDVPPQISESFCESGEGVRLPRERGWPPGKSRNFRGSLGNFRGSLGNFRGTSGLLLSSTVRELPGKSPKTSGEVREPPGGVQGLPRSSGEPDSLPATRQICLQKKGVSQRYLRDILW